MPIAIIDTPFDKKHFFSTIIDGLVMGSFHCLEFSAANLNQIPVLTLRDKTFVAVGNMMVKTYLQGWVIIFQVGGSAASIPIAIVVVDEIENVQKRLNDLLKLPEVVIETERKIYLETDTSEPIGLQTTSIKIPSQMLNIYAFKMGDFEGSWVNTEEYKNVNENDISIIIPLDMIDDPRDKKL
jgi:hypothetical protein